jgi:outer membrane autotransporter protein
LLDHLGSSHEAYDELLLVSDEDEARAAFDSLSGASHPSAFLVAEYVHDLFTRFAQDRLTASDAPFCWAGLGGLGGEMRFASLDDGTRSDASYGAESEMRMWGRAFGGWGYIESSPAVAETDFNSGGIAMGLEKRLGDSVIGLGLGFAETEGEVGAAHRFNIETVQFQTYAGTEAGPFEFIAALGAGRNSVSSKRTITVGAASDIARASYDGWTIGVSGEAGYKLVHGEKWRVTPFVGVDYTRTGQEGFTELGSSLGNLTVEEDSVDALRAVAGIRIQSTEKGFMRTRLSPALRVAYAREFLAGDAFAAAFASNPTAGFIVEGAELGRDRLLVSLGAAYRLTRSAQLGIGYDGDLSKDDQAHSATARLKVDF